MSDDTRPVRAGEAINVEKLAAFLGVSGEIRISQFPSGFSNLTYLVQTGAREMVLRRPPHGTEIRSAHDMSREFRVLSALAPVYPLAPKPIAFCDDPSVIGAPFYLMERLCGVVLRSSVPEGVDLNPETMRRLSRNFIDNLADIHAIDVAAAGLSGFGRPEGYIRRQMEGWQRRYEDACSGKIPPLEAVSSWLSANTPGSSGACLIHNDYKYDNVLLDAHDLTRLRAVFDWEMATVGDPVLDLGTALGYWVDPADTEEWRSLSFGLTTLPGNLTRSELAARYAQRTGIDIAPSILWAYVYALFKIAVIIQQIYNRYLQGHSRDERFAGLGQRVQATVRAAARALDRGTVSSR